MKLATIILIILFPFNLIAQEIEGHWHIYEIGKNQNILDTNNYHTLDIFNDQTAFIDKDRFNSIDNLLFNNLPRNNNLDKKSGYSIKNIDSHKKTIYSYVLNKLFGYPTMDYKIDGSNKLILSSTDQVKNLLAVRSRNCEEKDYCHLNSDQRSGNWCDLEISLPELLENETNNSQIKYKNYDFSIYLGYRKIEADNKWLVINFEKEKEIGYHQLSSEIKKYLNKVPEAHRGRVTANLFIDKDIPVIYCKYLMSCLQRSRQLRVRYIGKEHSLLRQLTPFTTNECEGLRIADDNCELSYLYNPNIFKFRRLLRSVWNPLLYHVNYNNYLDEKRKIYITLMDEKISIKWNNEQIKLEEFAPKMKKLLLETENSGEKIIFLIKTHPDLKYSNYIKIYGTINEIYETIWNKKASEEYNQTYNLLDIERKKKIRSSFPRVIYDQLNN